MHKKEYCDVLKLVGTMIIDMSYGGKPPDCILLLKLRIHGKMLCPLQKGRMGYAILGYTRCDSATDFVLFIKPRLPYAADNPQGLKHCAVLRCVAEVARTGMPVNAH